MESSEPTQELPPSIGDELESQYDVIEPQKDEAEQQSRNFVSVNRSAKDPDTFITLSSVDFVITAVIPCCWPLLLLTIPALLLSLVSKQESIKGKWEDAQESGRWALGLNITAIVLAAAVMLACAINFTAVAVSLGT